MKPLQMDLFANTGPLFDQPPSHAHRWASHATETALAEAEAEAEESPGSQARTVPAAFWEKAVRTAYSADRIAYGQPIRKPFKWDGALWCCIGTGTSGGLLGEARCFRLEPDPTGTGVPYEKWDWATMRGCTMGGYHGMAVKHGGGQWVLVGPEVTFSPA